MWPVVLYYESLNYEFYVSAREEYVKPNVYSSLDRKNDGNE